MMSTSFLPAAPTADARRRIRRPKGVFHPGVYLASGVKAPRYVLLSLGASAPFQFEEVVAGVVAATRGLVLAHRSERSVQLLFDRHPTLPLRTTAEAVGQLVLDGLPRFVVTRLVIPDPDAWSTLRAELDAVPRSAIFDVAHVRIHEVLLDCLAATVVDKPAAEYSPFRRDHPLTPLFAFHYHCPYTPIEALWRMTDGLDGVEAGDANEAGFLSQAFLFNFRWRLNTLVANPPDGLPGSERDLRTLALQYLGTGRGWREAVADAFMILREPV